MNLRFNKILCCVLIFAMMFSCFASIPAGAEPLKRLPSKEAYEEQFTFTSIASDTYHYFAGIISDAYNYTYNLVTDTSCAVAGSARDISLAVTDGDSWLGTAANAGWYFLTGEAAGRYVGGWTLDFVNDSFQTDLLSGRSTFDYVNLGHGAEGIGKGWYLNKIGGVLIGAAGTYVNAYSTVEHMSNNPYAGHNPDMEIFTNFLDTFGTFTGIVPTPAFSYTSQGSLLLSNILRMPYIVYAVNFWHDILPGHQFVDWVDHLLNAGTMDILDGGGSEYLQRNNVTGFTHDKMTPEQYMEDLYTKRLLKYAEMVQQGKEKEYEWLRDWLLDYQQRKKRDNAMSVNIEAKKPNIYLYPEHQTDVTVSFKYPNLLTKSDPYYTEGWSVTALPDGTLINANGDKYGYLFYESRVLPSCYQTENGFIIKSDERAEAFTGILSSYGFNSREISDFIDYWSEYLPAGVDYVMYPVYNDILDVIMPLDISTKPDTIFRVWFGFKRYDGSGTEPPVITPIERKGFTVVEWGGSLLD